MADQLVNIDFEGMAKAFPAYIRKKAVKHGNTIVYVKNGSIVEEDPKTNSIKILKSLTSNG